MNARRARKAGLARNESDLLHLRKSRLSRKSYTARTSHLSRESRKSRLSRALRVELRPFTYRSKSDTPHKMSTTRKRHALFRQAESQYLFS